MPVDIVLRTLVVMAAILLAGLLLPAGRRQRAALPGAMFAFAVAAFFLTSAPGSAVVPALLTWPLTALCVTKPVWFWLLARALFAEQARFTRRDGAIAAAVVAAVAIAGSWQQLVFLERYRTGRAGEWEAVAGFGFDGALAAFVVLGLCAAWRDLGVDLVERRRRLRLVFIVGTGAYLAAALAVQISNLLFDTATPLPLVRANMLIVTSVFLAAAGCLLQVRTPNWLEPARPAATDALTRLEAAVLAQLERLLEQEQVYLEEGLTIGGLARRLNTGEHVLRRAINTGMGYRNFNDFLHAWRIRAACAELVRPDQVRRPVQSIAMQLGYGSIGAFNRAFKARVGMTPTAYRRRHSSGLGVAG
jgi:AraC-like DNA-binding protein